MATLGSAAVLNEVAKDVTVVGDVAQTASDGYSWELAHNYLSTTAIQATLLVGTGDILAQAIETDGFSRKGGAEAYDAARTARMAMLGLIIAGFGTATWLRFLESQLPGHATWQRVVEKSTIDACIWAPIANTLYLVLVPLLEGKSPDEVGEPEVLDPDPPGLLASPSSAPLWCLLSRCSPEPTSLEGFNRHLRVTYTPACILTSRPSTNSSSRASELCTQGCM